MIYTPAQMEVAYKLALAHGHLWAASITMEQAKACQTPMDVIRAVEASGVHPDEQGIWHPNVMEQGPRDIKHTTGAKTIKHITNTGRSQWVILPDGQANLSIWRPNNESVQGACVIKLLVIPAGDLIPKQTVTLITPKPEDLALESMEYGTRHLMALEDMLKPLVSPKACEETIAALRAQAEAFDEMEGLRLLSTARVAASFLSKEHLEMLHREIGLRLSGAITDEPETYIEP